MSCSSLSLDHARALCECARLAAIDRKRSAHSQLRLAAALLWTIPLLYLGYERPRYACYGMVPVANDFQVLVGVLCGVFGVPLAITGERMRVRAVSRLAAISAYREPTTALWIGRWPAIVMRHLREWGALFGTVLEVLMILFVIVFAVALLSPR